MTEETTNILTAYMPMFFVLFIMFSQQRSAQRAIIIKRKKGKGGIQMNEVIKKYIGKNCRISTGTLGINVNGRIMNVTDKWIEVETKKGNELINSEFIQSIKIKEN